MPAAPEGLHLLLIDDDTLTRQLLELMLAGAGHGVTSCATGEAALADDAALADEAAPDAILCDLQLPGLHGQPLFARLRERFPAARLLGMSAAAPADDLRAALDGFLHKPFNADELHAALLPKQNNGQSGGIEASATASVLDEQTFTRLSAAMSARALGELYALGLADARDRIARITAAAAAADDTELRRQAHALRGSAAMLGAVELRTLAGSLETGSLPGTSPADLLRALERLRRMLGARIPELPSQL